MGVKRSIAAAACAGLLTSGCLSASQVDSRLTSLGRVAVPLAGQSQSQHVDDASTCRERIMDGLYYMGAYALYNPLATWGPEAALQAAEQRFGACLRERGYAARSPGPGR
jgi:hypothetical protein